MLRPSIRFILLRLHLDSTPWGCVGTENWGSLDGGSLSGGDLTLLSVDSTGSHCQCVAIGGCKNIARIL